MFLKIYSRIYSYLKNTKIPFFLLCSLLFIFTSILSGCEFFLFKSEPERTVFSFFNDLNFKDIERIYDRYLLDNDKSDIGKDDFTLLISKSLTSVKKIELKKTDLLKRDDEIALVNANFIIYYTNDREEIRTEEIFLIYEDGKWKVDFEKTFLPFK